VTEYNGIQGYVDCAFGECIPFVLDGKPIKTAASNELSKCYMFSYVYLYPINPLLLSFLIHFLLLPRESGCNGSVQAPVAVPPGVNYPNAGDAANLAGESAVCYEL
jgi:hypothetical protein